MENIEKEAELFVNQSMRVTGDIAQRCTSPKNLTQIVNGGSAKVIELQGGHHFVRKLYAMGIVPDTIIIKKSASLMKGPIVIEKDNMQFAIGYRMAQGIIVEPIEKD